MADASKITVNGQTYNVKDPTARDAASAAQTTAAGKLSDAPSDGKEYLRKNGAWAEPSGGGGSGVPDGGTIGQVLAKRSNTDGDAGWYSLRHLPSDKWYLPDGILENDVIAAYQFVDRLDEAEALLNVNDGAEYPLSKVLGTETWSAVKGFFIPATLNAGLNNAALVSSHENVLAAAFGYAELDSSSKLAPGIRLSSKRVLDTKALTAAEDYTNTPGVTNITGTGYRGGTYFGNSVLSCNFANTPELYSNGSILSLTSGMKVRGNYNVFGQISVTWNYSSCYVTALVFYNIALTSAQHLELSDNIRALGGID